MFPFQAATFLDEYWAPNFVTQRIQGMYPDQQAEKTPAKGLVFVHCMERLDEWLVLR